MANPESDHIEHAAFEAKLRRTAPLKLAENWEELLPVSTPGILLAAGSGRMLQVMIAEKIPALAELNPTEKLALATELWEEVERLGDKLPITEDQKRILDERFAMHGANPAPGRSWTEVKDRLLAQLEE